MHRPKGKAPAQLSLGLPTTINRDKRAADCVILSVPPH